MEIRAYKDLQRLHTFGVPWQATVFCALDTVEEVSQATQYAIEQGLQLFVLGGGSNILPVGDFDGLVIKNQIVGREVLEDDGKSILLRVGAGEVWHDLVVWTVSNGYYGLENLALIPGSVGGAVVQNIGAYDVEISSRVHSVEVVCVETGETETKKAEDCQFLYRNSIFKDSPGQWVVTAVICRLPKTEQLVLTYPALQERKCRSAEEVMRAVIDIRESKLPDWRTVGTAGSFFRNPRLSEREVERLRDMHAEIPVFHNYGTEENTVPAGWLIEHAGLPDNLVERFLYEKHKLVVINPNKNTNYTTGAEIAEFTKQIEQKVQEVFNITLIPEVIIL